MNTDKQFQIFLDLDGLFADFNGGFKEITGLDPTQVSKKVFWKHINNANRFFWNLKVIPGSQALWKVVQPTNPIFLTGLPSTIEGRDDKVLWVHKHYGNKYEVIVIPRRDKCRYAKHNHILIDDHESNIVEWRASGGLGIFHRHGDYAGTISELKRILKQNNWE